MPKFFDPICYQLIFVARSDEPKNELMRSWALETVQDLTPYILDYAKKTKNCDLVLSQSRHVQALTSANANVELQRFVNELAEGNFSYVALRNTKKRPPDSMMCNLSGSEAKRHIERVVLISPNRKMRPTVEKICAVSNCPDPLLRSVVFPVANAWDCFFTFSFTCQEFHDGGYYHKAEIQLPRVLLDRSGTAFPFQDKWASRLKSACEQFEYAHGALKMDVSMSYYHPDIINGIPTDPCMSSIPGYGWGLCLTPAQAERLRQSKINEWNTFFYKQEDLPHGGMYLQLTDDINRIEQEENECMIEFLRPFLQNKHVRRMDNLPNSCRLALHPEDITLDETIYSLRLP